MIRWKEKIKKQIIYRLKDYPDLSHFHTLVICIPITHFIYGDFSLEFTETHSGSKKIIRAHLCNSVT